jgi:hypothetical protein
MPKSLVHLLVLHRNFSLFFCRLLFIGCATALPMGVAPEAIAKKIRVYSILYTYLFHILSLAIFFPFFSSLFFLCVSLSLDALMLLYRCYSCDGARKELWRLVDVGAVSPCAW